MSGSKTKPVISDFDKARLWDGLASYQRMEFSGESGDGEIVIRLWRDKMPDASGEGCPNWGEWVLRSIAENGRG